jgi:PmbA protein
MKTEEFIEKLYQKANQSLLDEFEIYYSTYKSFSVKIFNQEIDSYKNAKSRGISLRGKFKGKMGYSYSAAINEKSIDELISEVIENAKVIENDDEEYIFEGSSEYQEINNYNSELEKIDVNNKIEFTKKLEQCAKLLDDRVKAVDYCMFSDYSGKRIIRNSKGLNLSSIENDAYAYISVVVSDGTDNKTDSAFKRSRNFSDFNFEDLARDAVSKAVAKFGGVSIESGKYPVIFENKAFSDLLEAFSGIFSAEAVDKGLSKLKDKIGKKVSVSELTIIDDPFYPDGPASCGFDDEGVATTCKKVIDNGVLTTYLHNIKSARKFGVTYTGNGKKGSYASTVKIAPSNFYIEKGKKNLENIIGDIKSGVLLSDLAGLHSGLNCISGDFSLLAEGFYIRNGKREFPLFQITVSGNFFDLIQDIIEIASDFEFGMNSFGSPSILIGELMISGK